MARNAEWPSFMWNTVGLRSMALESAHAADAQHDLLANARIVVAAVELVGDGAIFGSALSGSVGIEEVAA